MVWIASGSVTSAITRSVPPHSGQTEISISNTRLSRSAQLSGEQCSARSTAVSVEARIVGIFDLLRAGFAEPGTTARLNGELGAKPLQSCKSIELDWTGVAVPALPTGRESPRE
jgi:hypothetical protein